MNCNFDTVVTKKEYTKAYKWFEEVNHTLRSLSIPYCVLYKYLGKAEHYISGDASFSNPHLDKLPAGEKRAIVSHLQKLKERTPVPEIYVEIKDEIAKSAIDDIREIFPDMRSAIVLGDPLGDVDIGLILDKEDKREIKVGSEYFEMLKKFWRKYPLIDFLALNYFRSASGKELANRLIQAHCEAYEKKDVFQLDAYGMNHLGESIVNSWLLYGYGNDYREFMVGVKEVFVEVKNYLEKIKAEAEI